MDKIFSASCNNFGFDKIGLNFVKSTDNDEDEKFVSRFQGGYLNQARRRLIKNYVLDPDVKLIG